MNSRQMNRREFLRSIVCAGGAAAFGGCRMFSFGGRENLTVFISDTHVGTESAYQLGYLRRTVDAILGMHPRPKRVVCFGDIAYLRGPVEDYRLSRPEFERLPAAGIDLVFAMGNHDRRANFLEVWPEYRGRTLVKDRFVNIVDLGDADLLLLDTLHELDERSTEEDENRGWITPGQLKGEQLEWLKTEMPRRKRPFFLGAHHAVNEITDGDWKAVNDLVMATPLCVGWIHGHDHEWFTRRIKKSDQSWWGVFPTKRMLGLPSTGHWGDLGFVRFTTDTASARAELEITDHFFPRVVNRQSPLDDDLVAEKRGAFMTFRW